VQLRGHGDLAHEPSQGHPIAVVNAGLEPNLRHRAVDEVPQRHDAAGQHRTRAPADADCATLQGFEREVRDVDLVPELMSESAQTERLLAPARFLLEASVFGDGLGDGRVKAAIQGVKVLGTDERAALDRQLGDRLADVPVSPGAPSIRMGARRPFRSCARPARHGAAR
jgi:hypothetical protein